MRAVAERQRATRRAKVSSGGSIAEGGIEHPGPKASAAVSAPLLAWYDRERRDLPWRAAPGIRPDPYAVWLSEVMLQQTTVKAVAPYFATFLDRWPTVEVLAAADEEDVLKCWAGLGYYSRARNLHQCAKVIVADYGGQFPRTEVELRRLPGVGPYTAAAIAAIAFEVPATPVDGNIERVVARLFRIETLLPAAKPQLKAAAATLTPAFRPGDFAQAMMDLGATVCTPKRPSCLVCPIQIHCTAFADGIAETLPRRAQKAERPVRRGAAFVAIGDDGTILLRQRHDTGLLARMLEVPGSDWSEAETPDPTHAMRTVPVKADWWRVPGLVAHTFTHFRLELDVFRSVVPRDAPLTIWADSKRCRWVARSRLHEQALPSVMRKVISHALRGL